MAKLNSSDIAEELAARMGISKTAAKTYTNFIFESILSHVEGGDEVSISRFGRFRMVVTAPRNGTNVHTREAQVIPAKTRLKFEMSRWLKGVYDKGDSPAGAAGDEDEADT